MATPNHKGPPLPSESGHGVVGPRRQKFGEVITSLSNSTTSTSYSSNTTASRRNPSPLVSRTVTTTAPATAKRQQTPDRRQPNTPSPAVKRPDTPERRRPKTPSPAPAAVVVKRDRSTERRRPSTPEIDSGERSAAAAKPSLGSWSRRSLSFSFQGDSFSIPTKPAPASQVGGVRKATPERRRATENIPKPIEQRRWPSLREVNSFVREDDSFLIAENTPKTMLASQVGGVRKMTPEKRRVMKNLKPIEQHRWPSLREVNSFVRDDGFDPAASDIESVCSERSGREQERRTIASFLQETSKPKNNEAMPITLAPLRINAPMNKLSIDSPISTPPSVSSSKGTFFSPFHGAAGRRPASPSRRSMSSVSSTPRRGPSPYRVRAGVEDHLSNSSLIVSFDEYVLRLMYNRYLQWRFLNARADVETNYEKITREKSLYNAWVETLKLRRSVASKRAEIQQLQRSLKLHTILKGQMQYLNDWGLIDGDISSSLSGATNALVSSTLRLPVVGGARANIQSVKDAIGSAVDVMQAMASSIGSLLPKVEKVNSIVIELARVTAQERAFLDQCEDLLSMLIPAQVRHCSIRTQLIQLSSEGSCLRTEIQQTDFIDKGKFF